MDYLIIISGWRLASSSCFHQLRRMKRCLFPVCIRNDNNLYFFPCFRWIRCFYRPRQCWAWRFCKGTGVICPTCSFGFQSNGFEYQDHRRICKYSSPYSSKPSRFRWASFWNSVWSKSRTELSKELPGWSPEALYL